MLILVDYDNLPYLDRSSGVDHVVRKLLALLPFAVPLGQRIRVRLYGGWYEANKLTKQGQRLFEDMRSHSPVRITQTDGSVVLADVELVYSSLAHPKTLVGNTYREQSIRDGIRCQSRPWLQCADEPGCPIAVIGAFFTTGVCANAACFVRPKDLLTRMEQKVVDTMMVADLACAQEQGYHEVCVVSRDDDIWPGIGVAVLKVRQLFHVSTANSSRLPKYFGALPSPPYQLILWGS